MKRIINIIVFVALPMLLSAQQVTSKNEPSESMTLNSEVSPKVTKAQADSAYAKGDFALAIELYENILSAQGESSDIYYNLGNSYYKSKDIARAILNYERAYLLNPGDSDIRFNLELARNNTVDKVEVVNVFFLTQWMISLRSSFSADGWSQIAIICFLFFLLFISIFVFSKYSKLKRLGFGGTIICLLLVIFANVCAYQQQQLLVNRQTAIVIAPSVTVKSTPDNGGTDLFIIHEGHKIKIKDASMKEWYEIQLEDGSVGWIPKEVIEII